MPKLTDDRMLSCSQLPGLMGHSKWSKPNDVLEYAVKAINGEDPRTDAGEAASWGNALEPAILAEMSKRLGIDKWHSPDRAFKHPTLPLGASADAIAEMEGTVIHHDPGAGIYVVDGDSIVLDGIGVLESKLTRGHPEDVLPLYRGPIQVQGVMMCTGAKWAAIGTLYSGVELRIFLFKPHAATQQAIRDATVDFESRLHDYQSTGQMNWYPAADSDDANRIWPLARDEEIDLGEEAPRQILSGLAHHMPLDKVKGAMVVCICNLKPRKIGGMESAGMVLCAGNADKSQLGFVTPPAGAAPGERVSFEGYEGGPESASKMDKKKAWETIQPLLNTTPDGVCCYKEKPFTLASGVCTASVPNGGIS